MTQGQSVEQLQAEIEQARARLAATVDELAFRAQPAQIVQREQERLRAAFLHATRDEQGELRTERIAAVLAAVAAVSIALGLLRRANS